MNSDEKWMRRALALAKKGMGRVHPNPMVGAVVVKNGRVVGEGFHERFGQPHAEVHALAHAGRAARGATLYLTLEPCSHWGKTPPCVEAVIGSGVREVVVAMTDPNPRVAGRGVRALKRNGIRVRLGLLSDDARELNRAFTTSITSKRPYVTLKAAMSLDGKTATGTGESKWITGAAARSMGHAMRAEAGAIAVGVNTVLRDNPSLSAHGKGRDPLRVVFDRRLRTPRTANVVSGRARTLLFCSSAAPAARRKFAGRDNVDVVPIAGNKSGLRVREALRVLHENGVAHLLVEGGGTLAASFLEERLVDEVVWFVAPILIGGALARTPLEGRGFARLRGAPRIRKWRIAEIGDDLCIRGTVGY